MVNLLHDLVNLWTRDLYKARNPYADLLTALKEAVHQNQRVDYTCLEFQRVEMYSLRIEALRVAKLRVNVPDE